jgi:NAD(P)-dependent dehydrogenase (short-subunit alcohol dehydrogenase family)
MKGKVAIVTGAGSGIGAACAKEFAARGAAVVVADINGDAAAARTAEIAAAGGQARAFQVNVAEEAGVRAMIEAAVTHYGRLDILHNNAAATFESQNDDDLTTTDPAVWDLTFAVNIRGAMLGCKFAIPHMIAGGGGVIVNTSSGSGIIGEPTRFAYGASKAALNSLTRSIAARYGKQNIRCVAVAPGITMPREAQEAMAHTGWLAMMRRHHATPHLAVPVNIAKFVAFLASDEASFITGSVHSIDGGIHTAAAYAADMRENGTGVF